jgi:hypothetical protein
MIAALVIDYAVRPQVRVRNDDCFCCQKNGYSFQNGFQVLEQPLLSLLRYLTVQCYELECMCHLISGSDVAKNSKGIKVKRKDIPKRAIGSAMSEL